jgi:hypothetical protein
MAANTENQETMNMWVQTPWRSKETPDVDPCYVIYTNWLSTFDDQRLNCASLGQLRKATVPVNKFLVVGIRVAPQALGIVGSNPTRGTDICPHFPVLWYSVYVQALLWTNLPFKES